MRTTFRIWILLASVSLTGPALAQSGTIDLRVGKLEKEMKAVQRTVFPQGVPVQPETGGSSPPAIAPGSPATAPIADLTARVDALEKGLASLTGQVEQVGFQLKQQNDAIKRLETRVLAVEGSPVTADARPVASRPLADTPTSVARSALVAKVDPGRKAAVAAVEIPATGDAAEDAYTYGYRLYSAKFYPEAEMKLKEFTAKYPSHKRYSYAQNLLGRAYYDEGKPALASVAFYDNYQKMPKGERAPESLYWLGQALTKLKKLSDACKVYDELSEVYGSKLAPDLKAKATKGRADARCSA